MSKSGKGSQFERSLSKRISLWWTDGDRDDVIWRTQQSGGRATQRAKSGQRTRYNYGDLTFTDPIAKPLFDLIVISAKRGYTKGSGCIDVLNAIDCPDNKGNTLISWVTECYRDAELSQVPYWWLVFKRDRCAPICLMPEALHLDLALCLGRIKLDDWGAHCILISNRLGSKFRLAALDDVLKWCSPKAIAKLSKKFYGKVRTEA